MGGTPIELAEIFTRATRGIESPSVAVQVHLSNGLPAFNIVGLPETAVRESKERVRSALLNSHFEFPARRITVNLAPAELPKDGGGYDLAIAMGILAASQQIPTDALHHYEFVGELALSGALRGIAAILPAAVACAARGKALIVATENADSARLVKGLRLFAADHLLAISAHLFGQKSLSLCSQKDHPTETSEPDNANQGESSLNDVIGQDHAKRALKIAACGGHHTLFYGPPGAGKTMLASRFPSILPSLSDDDALEVAVVYSVAGKALRKDFYTPPFRAPHHTASAAALVGGGSHPRPGEISLAHLGVLFLDELPEFSRAVLEVLRQPLESGEILISRVAAQLVYPARFQLLAAMNPCPCGYLGYPQCQCTTEQIKRYRAKVSGPLMDRIDLQVQVLPIAKHALTDPHQTGTQGDMAALRATIVKSRRRQFARQGFLNSQLDSRALLKYCPLDKAQKALMHHAIDHYNLSTRSYYRVLRVARSIADLEDIAKPKLQHYQEALSFRQPSA